MSDKRMDELLEQLREEYNVPPQTPRQEMWDVIEAGLGESGPSVISLDRARRGRRPMWHGPAGWAAAAAALLVMGVGIGRLTAPMEVASRGASLAPVGVSALRTAAVEHLGETEALLTLVRAEGRGGTLDPVVRPWAVTLLTQTRLLLDTPGGVDSNIRDLLEDLELALVQIVGVGEAEAGGSAQAGVELDLALRGLDNRELMPRLQAILPELTGLAGT
jgi:hypothetical protein